MGYRMLPHRVRVLRLGRLRWGLLTWRLLSVGIRGVPLALLRLTGLDVEENQARRLLNDLDSFRAATDRLAEDEAVVAHDWLVNVYEPTVRAVPRELRGKLEAAEVFHEVLEHRWYLSERAGRDLPLADTIADYVRTVLPATPGEQAVVGIDTRALPVLGAVELPTVDTN